MKGQWRAQDQTGFDLFSSRLDDFDTVRWLRTPSLSRHKIEVETITSPPLSISSLKISATGCSASEGNLTIRALVNPTRTLSSLLARFGSRADFLLEIFRMDEIAFFALPMPDQAHPAALDGGDNYIPDNYDLRTMLGDDPFAAFLPIFLGKLRALVARVLREGERDTQLDLGQQVFGDGRRWIRVDWQTADVPQVETYFERYHYRAVTAVRTAGLTILDGDPDNAMRLYPGAASLERRTDQLFVATDLQIGRRHRLVIYAKTPSRIRFEVRRLKLGRIGSLPEGVTGSAHDRRLLHALLNVERNDAARLVGWEDIFRACAEPDAPSLGDLPRLIAAISHVSRSDRSLFQMLVERLLIDGGLSVGIDIRISEAVVRRLVSANVIERTRLRSRMSPGQKVRYQLTENYRWLRRAMLDTLISRGQSTS